MTATKQILAKYWYFSSAVAGVISGIAVAAFLENAINPQFLILPPPELLLPGAIFGLVSAGYFFYFLNLKSSTSKSIPPVLRSIMWVAASSVSYVLAFLGSLIGGYGLGGLIGVSVLVIVFHLLFLHLRWHYVVILFLLGALIPAVLISPLSVANYSLYISWQTMVMLVLGHRIHSATIQQFS